MLLLLTGGVIAALGTITGSSSSSVSMGTGRLAHEVASPASGSPRDGVSDANQTAYRAQRTAALRKMAGTSTVSAIVTFNKPLPYRETLAALAGVMPTRGRYLSNPEGGGEMPILSDERAQQDHIRMIEESAADYM
jgi:hypothetical protein